MNPGGPQDGTGIRLTQVVAAAAVMVAFAGFLTGLRAPEVTGYAKRGAVSGGADARAPSYTELRQLRRGPNAGMYLHAFDALRDGGPGLLDAVEQSAADKANALLHRDARRAYDGAPPTIPHQVDPMAVPDCVTCHQTGAWLAGKVAPRISHELYPSCTQCHVVSDAPRDATGAAPEVANDFAGMRTPTAGERAWPGAPPTIPHSTQMRSECESCHGTGGLLGMRSTYLYWQSCTQCHAPSAALDQRVTASELP